MDPSRSNTAQTTEVPTAVGAIRLDRNGHRVLVDPQPVTLTPTEFRLLETLVRQPGRAFTRRELVQAVMTDAVVLERTIDVHVRALRRKLCAVGRRIEAVRGVGYRFK